MFEEVEVDNEGGGGMVDDEDEDDDEDRGLLFEGGGSIEEEEDDDAEVKATPLFLWRSPSRDCRELNFSRSSPGPRDGVSSVLLYALVDDDDDCCCAEEGATHREGFLSDMWGERRGNTACVRGWGSSEGEGRGVSL
jgi:hypothetical protein